MADINDFVESMGGAEIDSSGPAGTITRLAEQLGHTSIEDFGTDNDDRSRRPSLSSTTRCHSDEEHESGGIREEGAGEKMEQPSSEAPLKHVLIAYYQNLRRLPPDSQSYLSALLRQRKGTQFYTEYNMWLNSQGWGLQNYSLPESVLDLEILSLAMAIQIRERWGTRHKTRPRNAVYFRSRIVDGQTVQVGFMPPLSPPGHPYYPYWLPDPDAGEGYDGQESEEEQFQEAREFLLRD
jgi:hypothetical protein